MPIKILIVCFVLFFNLTSMAQENMPTDLLDITKYKQNRHIPYSGGTFVHIDLPSEPTNKSTFVPTPLQLSGTYAIKTPFGKKTEASFIPHTTDFSTIIQILGNGDVIMEQTIQFVNTKKTDYFSRSFQKNNDMEFLLFKSFRENTPIDSIKTSQTDTHWMITDETPLPTGIHSYTLSYLIKNALQPQGDKMRLNLSLTGSEWSLPVERFTAVVLFPQKTNATQTLTFGSNNIALPDAVRIQTDNDGNISYTLTRPLPAYADVKVDIVFDKNVLSTFDFWDNLMVMMNHWLFVFCGIVLALYTLITRLYLTYHMADKLPLKDLKYYSPIALRFMVNKPLSQTFIHTLQTYARLTKHSFWIPKLHIIGFRIKAFVFLNVMKKYILTMMLMIILTVFQAANTGFSLNICQICILITLMILFNVWLFKTGEKTYINKKMSILIKNLLTADIGYGASKASLKALFLRFYPYALVMDKQEQWTQKMQQYGLDTSFYPFDKEEK